MLILELVINVLAAEKLAARGITGLEVEQVIAMGPFVQPNHTARVPGSIVVIGPTDAARFLTLILQPDEASSTRWHVMTGWDSSARQIAAYQRGR